MKWNAGEEVKNRCRLSSLEQAAAQSSLYVYVDAFSQKHIKKVSLISSLARSQHLWASQDEFHIFEENKVAGIILATFVLNRERENFLARVEKTFFFARNIPLRRHNFEHYSTSEYDNDTFPNYFCRHLKLSPAHF